jgi:hypothetical protein
MRVNKTVPLGLLMLLVTTVSAQAFMSCTDPKLHDMAFSAVNRARAKDKTLESASINSVGYVQLLKGGLAGLQESRTEKDAALLDRLHKDFGDAKICRATLDTDMVPNLMILQTRNEDGERVGLVFGYDDSGNTAEFELASQ